MTTAVNITPFFEPSIKSPEGKTWSQNLFLTSDKEKANVYKGAGKTDNGNAFLASIDLNIKESDKGRKYAGGYIKIDGVMLHMSLFPTTVDSFPALKFHGVVQEGSGESQQVIADLDVVEYANKEGEIGYFIRLKTPYKKAVVAESVVADF